MTSKNTFIAMTKKITFILLFAGVVLTGVYAQTFDCYSSSDNNYWKKSVVKTEKKNVSTTIIQITGNEDGLEFKNWGTCFNELGWDALNLLPRAQQETILSQLFSPDGDLRFSMGRIPMNANDYARDWYSCDEVAGDFQLVHFNINRDKTTLIPFIKAAQKYNPGMTFWISPWSPPSWLKVNQYYSVKSDKNMNQMSPKSDIVLFGGKEQNDNRYFPQQLTVNDYLIQDSRYLTTYANYFCRFISAYKNEGIPVTKVFFQNEPYSYTIYPGCAWTAEGMIRFNVEYLAPALKKQHPGVDAYLGTINSNRIEDVDKVLADPRMSEAIKGVGFQWEGGQILPAIRKKYPQYKYVQTESECGWGSFDWKAAEHTFGLINHYLANGVEEYTFWNAILADEGVSGWGWKQNALIRVDSKSKSVIYTPEYFAVKHYTHFVSSGSKLLTSKESGTDKIPMLVFVTPQKKYVLMIANFNDTEKSVSLQVNSQYLNVKMQPHALYTLAMK